MTRNVLWDQMAEEFGFQPRTPQEQRLWGRLCAELKAGEVTPQELKWAARGYKRLYPRAAFTPPALVKHFSAALEAGKPGIAPSQRQREVVYPLDEGQERLG